MLCVINIHDESDLSVLFQDVNSYAVGVFIQQRFSNCGPRTTSGPRVLPLWSF